MSEANTDRITPLPWKSWKTEMFNKHKTRGLDEWASGYNVGLDNGLQEAVEIYEQSAKLEALNAELLKKTEYALFMVQQYSKEHPLFNEMVAELEDLIKRAKGMVSNG
jgi:hypothetical protein